MTVARKVYDLWSESRSLAASGTRDLIRVPAPRRAAAPAPSRTWPRRLIRAVDRLQRRAQGVFEFSGADDCLLRIAVVREDCAVCLADGTRVERGQPVAALHLWNEHLPPPPASGPSFAWVNLVRRQMIGSFAALADYAEAAPDMREVTAYRARIAFAPRGRRAIMVHVAARFGFERIEAPKPPGLGRRVHDFFDNVWMWGLLWTFNPRGLAHQGFFRDRDDYWISRATLLARYGRDAARRRQSVTAGIRLG